MLMKVIAFLLALVLAVTALPSEAVNREKRQGPWGTGMWGGGMMNGMMGGMNRPPPPPPRNTMMGGWGNSGWRGGW